MALIFGNVLFQRAEQNVNMSKCPSINCFFSYFKDQPIVLYVLVKITISLKALEMHQLFAVDDFLTVCQAY